MELALLNELSHLQQLDAERRRRLARPSLVNDVAIKLELSEEEIPRVRNLEEVRMSLLQRAERWTQEWKAEGRAEGMAEGMAEGEAKGRRLGMAETLKNLAQRRFGDLPDWALDRIDRADVDTLERWTYRILDATALDDVFRDDEPNPE